MDTPTPEPTPAFAHFSDGTWEIGVDFPAGIYRAAAYTDGCYWARLRGFSGELADIITSDFGSGFQVVTILASDAGFKSDGCGDWTDDLSRVTDSDTAFDEGTYIVGTDIKSGTYEADTTGGCYWARLKGFKGSLDEIITSDFTDSGHAIVRIQNSDAGFKSSGCGPWTLRP